MTNHNLPRHSTPTEVSHRARLIFWSTFIVSILTILLVFILPVAVRMNGPGPISSVKVEISGFESNLLYFKTEFGVDPPSRVFLYESGEIGERSWSQDAQNPGELDRSRTVICRLWPQFDFSLDRDLNGDGDTNDVIKLTGAECLVFFLGGVGTIIDPSQTDEFPTPLGFSKNPRNPFERGEGTRIRQFHEFDTSRFVDRDRDGAQEYLPDLPGVVTPYLYVSSYDGAGYEPDRDSDIDGDGRPDLALQIDTNGDGHADRNVPQVFLQESTDLSQPQKLDIPWMGRSYQIIAAGFDDEFGAPGVYTGKELLYPIPEGMTVLNPGGARDNITNFCSGELVH